MRNTLSRQIKNLAKQAIPPKIHQGRLAEEYDGVGQYVMINLASSSVASALRARVAAGDYGTGQRFPVGTPVTVSVHRGKVEILSLGNKIKLPDPLPPTQAVPPVADDVAFVRSPGNSASVACILNDGAAVVAIVSGGWISDSDADAVTASWSPGDGNSYPMERIHRSSDSDTYRITMFAITGVVGGNGSINVALGGNCFGAVVSYVRIPGGLSSGVTPKLTSVGSGTGSPMSIDIAKDEEDLVIGAMQSFIGGGSVPTLTVEGFEESINEWFGSVFQVAQAVHGYGGDGTASASWSGSAYSWVSCAITYGGVVATEGDVLTGGPNASTGESSAFAPLDHDHDAVLNGDPAGGELGGTYPNPTLGTHQSKHNAAGSDPIKLDDLAAPDDNTDLNATDTRHGLLPKLSGVATEYLDGTGAFSTPAGGGGGGGGEITQAYVGKDAIGASNENWTNRRIFLKQFTLAEPRLITSIEVYMKGNGGNVVALNGGIYEDSAGAPSLLRIAPQTETFKLFISTTPRWVGIPIAGLWLPAGTYWAAASLEASANTHGQIYYDASGSDKYITATGNWLLDASLGTVTDTVNDYSIRINTIRGGDGGGGSGSGLTVPNLLNSTKSATDTPDDDFDGSSLDAKWIAVDGTAGSVSLLSAAGAGVYQVGARDSWLLMQVGTAVGDSVLLRQDFTLPDGACIVVPVSWALDWDAAAPAENEFHLGIGVNDNDTGPAAGTDGQTARLLLDISAAGTWRILGIGTSSVIGTDPGNVKIPAIDVLFLRIDRVGLTYHLFYSQDGFGWTYVGDKAMATAADNLWLYADCAATMGNRMVVGTPWVRQGTALAVDPWPLNTGSGGGSGTFPPSWSPDALTHDYEFDAALSGWTDLGTPTKDADSTADSHLYLERASAATVNWDGIYRAIPATPFTLTAKLTDVSIQGDASKMTVALIIGAATPGAFVGLGFYADTRHFAACEMWDSRTDGTPTLHGSVRYLIGLPAYLRFVVNSTTSYDAYASHNGLVWVPIVTGQNPGFTIGSFGLAVMSNGSPGIPTKAFFDWLDIT